MPMAWRLHPDGSCSKFNASEWYIVGCYRNIMPSWITDDPTKEDFDDWSSRIPSGRDKYENFNERGFSHGLFYRQCTQRGSSSWVFGTSEQTKKVQNEDLFNRRFREGNERLSVRFFKCGRCGAVSRGDCQCDISELQTRLDGQKQTVILSGSQIQDRVE